MPNHRFAILEHTLPDGNVHHDLLIDRPGEPSTEPEKGVGYLFLTDDKKVSDTFYDAADDDAKTLWAVRIDPPPAHWLAKGRLTLTPLPPHRRLYLAYEGPISRGRGSVRQVASGSATIRHWNDTEAEFTLGLAAGPLHLRLTPAGIGKITAHVSPATDS